MSYLPGRAVMNAPADVPTRTTSEKIEILTKAGAAGVGFLYLCGFLVVAMHLSGYGVYSIAFLRGQYLTAGIFSLGPLCLTYFVAAILNTWFGELSVSIVPLSGWPRARRTLGLLWKLAMGVSAVYVLSDMAINVIVSIFVPSARDILWTHFFALSWLMIQSAALTWVGINLWGVATILPVHELKQDIKKASQAVMLTVLFVVFLVGYLSSFARQLYPEIPFAIGGGKPQTVVFLIKQNHDGAVSPAVQSGKRSMPYKLVMETDTTYTVLSEAPKERAIQFNRDSVAGYVILSE